MFLLLILIVKWCLIVLAAVCVFALAVLSIFMMLIWIYVSSKDAMDGWNRELKGVAKIPELED